MTLLSQVRGSHLKTQHELFDLSAVIKDTVKILKNHRKLKNVSIRLNIPDSLSMSGCAIELHQMLLNLIINAADSIRESENKNSPLIEIILKSSSDSKENLWHFLKYMTMDLVFRLRNKARSLTHSTQPNQADPAWVWFQLLHALKNTMDTS